MKSSQTIIIYLLILLSIEKFIQHMVVTYAFIVDLRGIRDTVVVDHIILIITGFIVGILFLVNIPFLYQQKHHSFTLLFLLALFDFVGEFIAQGKIAIEITVSFIVASLLLLLLFFYRRKYLNA